MSTQQTKFWQEIIKGRNHTESLGSIPNIKEIYGLTNRVVSFQIFFSVHSILISLLLFLSNH